MDVFTGSKTVLKIDNVNIKFCRAFSSWNVGNWLVNFGSLLVSSLFG